MGVEERLRKSRERVSLNQGQAARAVGVPRELVSMWEGGRRNPNVKQIENLASLYGVSAEYLLGQAELEEGHERQVLFRGLEDSPEAMVEIRRWLDFLDDWAELLEDLGMEDRLTGPGKPRRALDEGYVTDARRAPKLAAKAREEYGLGRDAIPSLYAFLDNEGILVYRASLGSLGPDGDGISGAFFNHPKLGYCILVNEDTTLGRQAFTLTHEFAHALYHYSSGGIVCRRVESGEPEERFANAFAAHFLVPGKELRGMVTRGGGEVDAYEALRLASYFRVSYATLLNRLSEERLIERERFEDLSGYSPRRMAQRHGLDSGVFEVPEPDALHFERYPISVVEVVVEAIEEDELTVAQAADVLDVGVDVLQEYVRWIVSPPEADEEERREFEELPF